VVRNAGMMIGIELDRPCGELVKMALADKLLINVTADNVVRLLPPLVMNESEAKELVKRLSAVIKTFLNS
jgi:acetylornithine aminotransferase